MGDIPFVTDYNRGVIRRRGERVDMDVAGATFATWHPRRLCTGYSWDALSAAALFHPHSSGPKKILLLGLAGGTMLRILKKLLPDARITAVEIDGELVDIARHHMPWPADACEVVVGDAYRYLKRTRRRFDVVLDDVFLAGAEDVFRPDAPQDGWGARYQRVLVPTGIVAVNCITTRPHLPLLRRMEADLKNHFPAFTTITAARGYNRILIAGNPLQSPNPVHRHAARFPDEQDQVWWRKMNIEAVAGPPSVAGEERPPV